MKRLRALMVLTLASCSLKPPSPVAERKDALLSTTLEPLELHLQTYPERQPWLLSARRGHVVLLDVWATWCEPCLDALPHSQQLLERFATRGFEVYAINIDADPRPIASFLKEAQVTLPVVLDPEGRQAEERLKVSLMPTILLIDKRGKVRSVREGFDEEQLVKWTSEIEALLNEP